MGPGHLAPPLKNALLQGLIHVHRQPVSSLPAYVAHTRPLGPLGRWPPPSLLPKPTTPPLSSTYFLALTRATAHSRTTSHRWPRLHATLNITQPSCSAPYRAHITFVRSTWPQSLLIKAMRNLPMPSVNVSLSRVLPKTVNEPRVFLL